MSSQVDLRELVPGKTGSGTSGCIRCGTCCSSLEPGLTNQERYRDWIASGTLAGLFFREVARPNADESWYTG
ncbi:hypothetical protein KAJ77_00505, partial [bacterium]|nr:hypothetical protein [bacterium]